MNRKLKIAQVIPSLGIGGAERLVLNLASELESHGYEVKIFILYDDNHYHTLNSQTKVVFIPARISYSLLGPDTSDTKAFDKAIQDFAPNIVHSHLVEAEFISRHKPCTKAVYISHWHGCPEMLRKQPLSAFLKKDTWWNWNSKRNLIRSYRECNNHFLCVSEYMKSFVIENMDANPNDCSVICNAVDTELFSPKTDLSESSTFHLISIGKLNQNKNQQFLIRVVAELSKLGVDTDLTLLGSGDQEQSLKQLAITLNVESQIYFPGTVDNPEEYLRKSDVLIHSSHYEAFGLVLLEAMACGKPVVCFNDGGPAEVAVDGLNGFAVERNNLDAFSKAVAKLANDKALYSKLSSNALAFSQKYGLKQYAQNVLNLYEKLLAQKIA
jgi:glycosyltransferase involved in cell wall biosynthesis